MLRKIRPIVTALMALLFYTITDIIVWQRIFEANHMVGYANTYHAGWFVTLAGYGSMGAVLMWDDWKDCLYFLATLFVGAFSGLEDVMYYILDRKPIPAQLPWLARNPMIYASSRTGVISSIVFWLAILVIFYLILYIWLKDKQQIS
jgi:hypothetical protein